MSAIHTPFLGGTGFGGLGDSGTDSELAPPYVPGAESGFPAAQVPAAAQETAEDKAAAEEVADWAEDIIEEAEVEEGGLAPTANIDALVPTDEQEAAEEPAEEVVMGTGEAGTVEPANEEQEKTEAEFPDFLFGGDAGEDQDSETSMPSSGDIADRSDVSATSGSSPASRLDPETRERIRALAKELEGDDAAEDVIARAFEEGYRKAREEEA